MIIPKQYGGVGFGHYAHAASIPDTGVLTTRGVDERSVQKAPLIAANPLGDEVVALNRALRGGGTLESVASQARNPAAALAYLLAADRVIQVDDFAQSP